MNWKVKALYLYRNNKHYTVFQLYEEVFKETGSDRLHISRNDNRQWYLNGKLHREDGPALEYNNGEKYWLLNGKRHRENGPAVEYAGGEKYWYLNGKRLTKKEFNKRTK